MREMQGYVEQRGPAIVRKEIPSGVVPLIIVLDHGFTLHDHSVPGGRRTLSRSFVAGLHEFYALVGSAGQALCMQVDLTPLGARRLLGLDMDEIAGRVVDLRDLSGRFADELEGRLSDVGDWALRFHLLEEMLLERIDRGPAPNLAAEAARRTIERSAGDLRIADLAAALDCSRKHLVTLFRREVGLPPKAYARVLRFERAAARLQSGELGSLAHLAVDCGYADQAHFNRDFRAFCGESPRSLLRRTLPDGTGIVADGW